MRDIVEPDAAQLRERPLLPRALVEAERRERAEHRRDVERVLVPDARVTVRARGRAERAAEVDLVVLDVPARRVRRILHEHVERVVFLDVDVVEPREHRLRAAQVAAALVGDAVVRIVAARALCRMPAERLAVEDARREAADAAIGLHVDERQHLLELAALQRARVAEHVLDLRVGCEDEVARAEVHDVVLGDVPAHAPEQAPGDHARGGLGLGIALLVELEDEPLTARVLDDEADVRAADLRAPDRPRHVRLGAADVAGARAQLLGRHDARAEPAR